MNLIEIKKFIKDFEHSSLNSIELEIEGMKLKLNKQGELQEHMPVSTMSKREVVNHKTTNKEREIVKEKEIVEQNTNLTTVKSPLVGTYYSAPSPDDAPFVKVGDQVKKGQVLCIIEAMKIMNEISSPVDGVVKDISINNGDAVGFEQLIMTIE